MAKARMYGQKTTYIPNNRPDLRFIKKMQRERNRLVIPTVKEPERKGLC